MIVITKIDFIETERDPLELIHRYGLDGRIPFSNGRKEIEAKELMELIRGRRFVRPDGKEIVLGISRQAQDVLGIQYEEWHRMNLRLKVATDEKLSLMKELNTYTGIIKEAKKATIVQRIKWLFFGFR